jgi:hypothetical protein
MKFKQLLVDCSAYYYVNSYQSIHGFWTGLYQHIKLQFLLGFLIP